MAAESTTQQNSPSMGTVKNTDQNGPQVSDIKTEEQPQNFAWNFECVKVEKVEPCFEEDNSHSSLISGSHWSHMGKWDQISLYNIIKVENGIKDLESPAAIVKSTRSGKKKSSPKTKKRKRGGKTEKNKKTKKMNTKARTGPANLTSQSKPVDIKAGTATKQTVHSPLSNVCKGNQHEILVANKSSTASEQPTSSSDVLQESSMHSMSNRIHVPNTSVENGSCGEFSEFNNKPEDFSSQKSSRAGTALASTAVEEHIICKEKPMTFDEAASEGEKNCAVPSEISKSLFSEKDVNSHLENASLECAQKAVKNEHQLVAVCQEPQTNSDQKPSEREENYVASIGGERRVSNHYQNPRNWRNSHGDRWQGQRSKWQNQGCNWKYRGRRWHHQSDRLQNQTPYGPQQQNGSVNRHYGLQNQGIVWPNPGNRRQGQGNMRQSPGNRWQDQGNMWQNQVNRWQDQENMWQNQGNVWPNQGCVWQNQGDSWFNQEVRWQTQVTGWQHQWNGRQNHVTVWQSQNSQALPHVGRQDCNKRSWETDRHKAQSHNGRNHPKNQKKTVQQKCATTGSNQTKVSSDSSLSGSSVVEVIDDDEQTLELSRDKSEDQKLPISETQNLDVNNQEVQILETHESNDDKKAKQLEKTLPSESMDNDVILYTSSEQVVDLDESDSEGIKLDNLDDSCEELDRKKISGALEVDICLDSKKIGENEGENEIHNGFCNEENAVTLMNEEHLKIEEDNVGTSSLNSLSIENVGNSEIAKANKNGDDGGGIPSITEKQECHSTSVGGSIIDLVNESDCELDSLVDLTQNSDIEVLWEKKSRPSSLIPIININ